MNSTMGNKTYQEKSCSWITNQMFWKFKTYIKTPFFLVLSSTVKVIHLSNPLKIVTTFATKKKVIYHSPKKIHQTYLVFNSLGKSSDFSLRSQ